jgi:hypothetical protein
MLTEEWDAYFAEAFFSAGYFVADTFLLVISE